MLTLQQAQKLLANVYYKDDNTRLDLAPLELAGGCRVTLRRLVLDRGTYRPEKLTYSQSLFLEDHSSGTFLKFIYDLLLDFELHEVREHFRVGGEIICDPHMDTRDPEEMDWDLQAQKVLAREGKPWRPKTPIFEMSANYLDQTDDSSLGTDSQADSLQGLSAESIARLKEEVLQKIVVLPSSSPGKIHLGADTKHTHNFGTSEPNIPLRPFVRNDK